MEASPDSIEKIRKYEDRATQLIANAEALVKKGELEKAGEFFWGAIACYINALELLYTGKAHARHSEMVIEAKTIASGRKDIRLLEAIREAEKLHANYYHSFITKDEFPVYYAAAKYAFIEFQKILEESLSIIIGQLTRR